MTLNNQFILDSLRNSNMINVEQGINIYHLLSRVLLLKIPGDVVELGCWMGNTSIILQRTLNQYFSEKRLHVYDSFEGLPARQEQDGFAGQGKGWMKISVDALIYNFTNIHCVKPLPVIHKGWFEDILPTELPEQISFAHFDGDLYSSVKTSLKYVYPRLSEGAVVVIDDYYSQNVHSNVQVLLNHNSYSKASNRKIKLHDNFPGVKIACDEFLEDKPERMVVLIAGEEKHAYFAKGANLKDT